MSRNLDSRGPFTHRRSPKRIVAQDRIKQSCRTDGISHGRTGASHTNPEIKRRVIMSLAPVVTCWGTRKKACRKKKNGNKESYPIEGKVQGKRPTLVGRRRVGGEDPLLLFET